MDYNLFIKKIVVGFEVGSSRYWAICSDYNNRINIIDISSKYQTARRELKYQRGRGCDHYYLYNGWRDESPLGLAEKRLNA